MRRGQHGAARPNVIMYNKVENLKNRQLFDHAFHVVVDGESSLFRFISR